MAVRYYLTNSASDYTPSGSTGNWDATAGIAVKALSTAKAGASATSAIAETSKTNNWDVLLGRWVSDPIHTAGSLTGAISAAVAGLESSTSAAMKPRMVVYVETSGGAVRGEALDVSGATWGTSAAGQALSGTATSVSCQAFDRIVVEVGYTAVNTSSTSFTGTIYYGATDATDMSDTDTTTTHPAWVEFDDSVANLFAGALPSVPGFVGIQTYSPTTDATTHTVNIPSGNVGDALLLWVVTGSGSATISANKGFVAFEAAIGDTMQACAFGKIADGTEGTSLTVTLSTTYTICAAVARYDNVLTSGYFRDFASTSTLSSAQSATAPTRPALSGTQATDMVVGAWLAQDSGKGAVTPSQSSGGWTVRAAVGHPSGSAKDTSGLMVMDLLGATNNPSVTDGNAGSVWAVYDISLIPAPSPSTSGTDVVQAPLPRQIAQFRSYLY
jgi:hypothetical protein